MTPEDYPEHYNERTEEDRLNDMLEEHHATEQPTIPVAPLSDTEADQLAAEFMAKQSEADELAEIVAKAKAEADLEAPPAEDGDVPGWLKLWRSQEVPTIEDESPEAAQARLEAFERKRAIDGDELVKNMRSHQGTFKAPTYVIQGLIPRRTVGIVYGASGAKKTFIALHASLCVASGNTFGGAGGLPVRPGSVIYFAPEDFSGVMERYNGWIEHHNSGKQVERFLPLPYGINLIDKDTMMKTADKLVASAYFTANPISLIVVDTMSANNAGIVHAGKAVEENDNVSMATMMANAERLAVITGAAVMLIHHTGKDESKGMRGASALQANAGFAINVKSGRGGVIVSPQKNKGGGSVGDFMLPYKTQRLPTWLIEAKAKALAGMTEVIPAEEGAVSLHTDDYDSTLVMLNRVLPPSTGPDGPDDAKETRSEDKATKSTSNNPNARHVHLTTFIRTQHELNNGLGPSDDDLQAWADTQGLTKQQLSRVKYKAEKEAGLIHKRAGFWTTTQSGSPIGMAGRNEYEPGSDDEDDDQF
ncbi:primase/helicase [Serratia phage vB_SmaM-ChibiTotoro]|nr:primase/helicase [Serratia phage vB_SmaM-ChibiTotoro]